LRTCSPLGNAFRAAAAAVLLLWQVLGLRGVSVSPTVLESTTLVLCYGSDLFFTRISPALHFDSLQSDFSYGLLVVALLALTIGTWFAGYSSQQAMLKAKWQ
jgi:hypothetical protein